MKLILFDIDSTLLRDGGAAGKAFKQAFYEFFSVLPQPVDKFGKTDYAITSETAVITLNRNLSENELHTLHLRYCKLYPLFLKECSGFTLLPGVYELCEKLWSIDHFHLGLQTGNLEECALIKLKKGGLDTFFHFGGYGSDSIDRRTIVQIAIDRGVHSIGMNIPKSDILLIGDSLHDIYAGKENGVTSIGVATGKNSMNELQAAGADEVVCNLTKSSGIYTIIEQFSTTEKKDER